jgi:hypothetical protein
MTSLASWCHFGRAAHERARRVTASTPHDCDAAGGERPPSARGSCGVRGPTPACRRKARRAAAAMPGCQRFRYANLRISGDWRAVEPTASTVPAGCLEKTWQHSRANIHRPSRASRATLRGRLRTDRTRAHVQQLPSSWTRLEAATVTAMPHARPKNSHPYPPRILLKNIVMRCEHIGLTR